MNNNSIIYVRVSSDNQVKGTSLDFQEKMCRKYCKEKGLKILKIFREEGASAKTTDRKELLRALEFCRKNKNKMNSFVVYKVDRLARNTEDHFYVRKLLIENKITLHSVTEPIGNNPAEKFFETILAASSEFDNSIRSMRCTDGMNARINQGILPWSPPIGYKSQGFKKRGLKKTAPDLPDEKTFHIIQQGLGKYMTGTYSQIQLAKLLDELGLERIRGKKTTPQFVNHLLNKQLRFYAGILYNPFTKQEVSGLHEQMITKQELYKIEAIRDGKSREKKHKHLRNNPNFPLRRTVLCSECNNPLTGSFSTGRNRKHAYYHCHNKKCSIFGKTIRKQELEQAFQIILQDISFSDEMIRVFKATALDLWKEKGKSFELEAQRQKRKLKILEDKRKRIFEMREDGSYSKQEFQERKQQIENQITATKIGFSEAKIEQYDIESGLNYALHFIKDLARQWLDLSCDSRFRFQQLIFPSGISYNKKSGFGTAELGLIFKLNQQILAIQNCKKSEVVVFVRQS